METPRPLLPANPTLLNRLIDLDTRWSLYIHTKCLPFPRAILKALEISGDGRFWFPIPIALWLTHFAGNTNFNRILVHLFMGFCLDLLLVGLLKYSIRRPRPVYNKGMHLTVSVDHWSFPSGHSSRACFIGLFLCLCSRLIDDAYVELELDGLLGDEFLDRWFKFDGNLVKILVFYINFWSALTSVSRVLLGRHFIFDVIAGAILGVLEAFVMFYVLKSELLNSLNLSSM